MLKILGRKDSINVMKVLWTCEELNLPFERVNVGGSFGFAKQLDYLRLNPRWVGEQWMDWKQTTLLPPMRTVFLQLIRTPADRRGAAVAQAAHETLLTLWPMLDDHLSRNAFVAGSRFSMADIPLGCMAYRWYGLENVERPALKHLEAWWRGLEERPGYRRHLTLPLT